MDCCLCWTWPVVCRFVDAAAAAVAAAGGVESIALQVLRSIGAAAADTDMTEHIAAAAAAGAADPGPTVLWSSVAVLSAAVAVAAVAGRASARWERTQHRLVSRYVDGAVGFALHKPYTHNTMPHIITLTAQ